MNTAPLNHRNLEAFLRAAVEALAAGDTIATIAQLAAHAGIELGDELCDVEPVREHGPRKTSTVIDNRAGRVRVTLEQVAWTPGL